MFKEMPGLAQGREQDQGPGVANEDEYASVGLREIAMRVDLLKCVV